MKPATQHGSLWIIAVRESERLIRSVAGGAEHDHIDIRNGMNGPINDGLLGDGGIDLLGCELSLEEALIEARKHCKWMPLCVVKEWVILDAIVTDAEREKIAALGCLPVFLFAHRVVHDEQRRFEPGHWVRSGMATSFKEGFMFATRNTVYLLLGAGRRKPSSIEAIFSIC